MLKLYTTMVRHRPGHSANHGACSMYLRPSRLSMPPQSGMVAGRPNPRKPSAANAMITPPILVLNEMIMTGVILGTTWRRSDLHRDEPTASATSK